MYPLEIEVSQTE